MKSIPPMAIVVAIIVGCTVSGAAVGTATDILRQSILAGGAVGAVLASLYWWKFQP